MPLCTELTSALKVSVNVHDLPISCPLPTSILWSAHPRVYLSLQPTGYAICPYCNTEYVLTQNTVAPV